MIVTNKNRSTCFTRKSWNGNEGYVKEKEKKMAATPCLLSPLMPAKKRKSTSKNIIINISMILLSVVFKWQACCHREITGVVGRY